MAKVTMALENDEESIDEARAVRWLASKICLRCSKGVEQSGIYTLN
jgi:hypothetical protein